LGRDLFVLSAMLNSREMKKGGFPDPPYFGPQYSRFS